MQTMCSEYRFPCYILADRMFFIYRFKIPITYLESPSHTLFAPRGLSTVRFILPSKVFPQHSFETSEAQHPTPWDLLLQGQTPKHRE